MQKGFYAMTAPQPDPTSATPKPGEVTELRTALANAREASVDIQMHGGFDRETAAWSAVEAALVAAEAEREAMREAMELIESNCDPEDPPWREAEAGRLAVGAIARRALTKEPNG